LKDDKRLIFSAASQAQRAVDYLHGLQPNVRIPMNSAGDSGVMSATQSNRSRPAIPIDVGGGGVCPWAA
jgi:hypothetical protein